MGVILNRREFASAPFMPAVAQGNQASGPPNILFLISDDHSFPDLGCLGNPVVRTPNLDRLAAGGARFANCYVSSPQCSPNRSSIFTGCTPHTTSTSRLHTPMPPWEGSFLEELKKARYFTGAIRKVHQGGDFEKRFDYYDRGGRPPASFFDKLPKDRPFWFQVGFTDPHRLYKPGAFNPPHDPAKVIVPPFLPDTPEVRTDIGHYYDAIARMDSECGEVLNELERRGLAQNTLVMFTGDNGMPFPRAKGTCYDPGIHVPLIARWPGRIPAGTVRDALVAHVDLAPTWLEAAGLNKPAKMQGSSFLAAATGSAAGQRTAVFAERNWHDNFDPIRCVRTAGHKLIFNAAPHFPYRPAWDLEDSPTWQAMRRLSRRGGMPPEAMQLFRPARPALEFYDLREDPRELNNLIDSPRHADLVREHMQRLSQWMHDTYDFLPPAFPAKGEPPGRSWPVSL